MGGKGGRLFSKLKKTLGSKTPHKKPKPKPKAKPVRKAAKPKPKPKPKVKLKKTPIAKPKIKAKPKPKAKPAKKPAKPKPKPKAAAKPAPPPKPPTPKTPATLIFGERVKPARITDAAREAVRKRAYSTDDIHVSDYTLNTASNDNLMFKISILDRVQEEIEANHPEVTAERKNKITLAIHR